MVKFLPGFFFGVALFSETVLFAQEEQKSGMVQQSQTSVFEYILVAVLFGLALFAICRTSHRS